MEERTVSLVDFVREGKIENILMLRTVADPGMPWWFCIEPAVIPLGVVDSISKLPSAPAIPAYSLGKDVLNELGPDVIGMLLEGMSRILWGDCIEGLARSYCIEKGIKESEAVVPMRIIMLGTKDVHDWMVLGLPEWDDVKDFQSALLSFTTHEAETFNKRLIRMVFTN